MKELFCFMVNCGLLILLLIVIGVAGVRNEKGKRRFFYQNLNQTCVYAIEILIMCGVALLLIEKLFPAQGDAFWYTQLERFLSVYTVYQITVIVFLRLRTSSEIDEWTAVLTMAKLAALFLETGSVEAYEAYRGHADNFLRADSMVSKNALETVDNLMEALKQKDGAGIRLIEIEAENNIEVKQFDWNQSFLLRIFK